MTEGLADEMNRSTVRIERLYRKWSEGGAGLHITGNVQVDRRQLERAGNVAIDGNGGIEELKRYARAGTVAGNHLWMQINHPGRQTPKAVNASPLAPSAVPLKVAGDNFGPPRAMTEEDILDVIRRFAHVAEVARDTGFTGVQVHSAHGYLLSSFLSPLANVRTDAWGGSIENRSRALLEIVRAIRKKVGDDFPISVKLNSADFQRGGFSRDDSTRVIQMLNAEKVDLLEISGGNYEQPKMVGAGSDDSGEELPKKASTVAREAYFLQYAEEIRKVCTIPLMVSGGFRSAAAMNEALASGSMDVVGIGRPMCTELDMPAKLLADPTYVGPRWEDVLKLDRSTVPAGTSEEMIKVAEMWGMVGWFYVQLIRIGDGLEPDRDLSVWDAYHQYAGNELATAQRLQRAA